MSAEDVSSSMTSGCRQNKCKGHFCVYAAQRIFSNNWSTNRNGNNNGQQNSLNSPKMHEKRGCINVTTPTFVQLGCTHKWVQNELEEIYCACKGNTCNFDLAAASQSSAEKHLTGALTQEIRRRLIQVKMSFEKPNFTANSRTRMKQNLNN
uniref:Uncharacterized protein n=1 Tax=Meloidogyne incognita TaxID=6306 RepID=A0A914KW87_MELIC